MPFVNQHAARQMDPKKFDSFRRGRPRGFPGGVSVIFGIKNGKLSIQSIRFDKHKWTPKRARAWLKSHGFRTSLEEASIKSVSWNGVL